MKGGRSLLSILCLSAILVVLIWLIALQANAMLDRTPVSFASDRTVVPEPGEERLPEAFALGPAEQFAEIIERPLLHRSRRPPAAPLPTAPPPEQPLHASLRGIVAAGGERTALVAVEGGAELLRLSHGDSVSGWLVEEIADGGIRLSRGGESTVLQLGFRSDGPGGSPR